MAAYTSRIEGVGPDMMAVAAFPITGRWHCGGQEGRDSYDRTVVWRKAGSCTKEEVVANQKMGHFGEYTT